ncbi:hypothetical protein HK104_006648 [Borealophlyctis nickersoniae]|nr:hypothetical protein HK104_006648 [Borealophlyctis nickersoniae]
MDGTSGTKHGSSLSSSSCGESGHCSNNDGMGAYGEGTTTSSTNAATTPAPAPAVPGVTTRKRGSVCLPVDTFMDHPPVKRVCVRCGTDVSPAWWDEKKVMNKDQKRKDEKRGRPTGNGYAEIRDMGMRDAGVDVDRDIEMAHVEGGAIGAEADMRATTGTGQDTRSAIRDPMPEAEEKGGDKVQDTSLRTMAVAALPLHAKHADGLLTSLGGEDDGNKTMDRMDMDAINVGKTAATMAVKSTTAAVPSCGGSDIVVVDSDEKKDEGEESGGQADGNDYSNARDAQLVDDEDLDGDSSGAQDEEEQQTEEGEGEEGGEGGGTPSPKICHACMWKSRDAPAACASRGGG